MGCGNLLSGPNSNHRLETTVYRPSDSKFWKHFYSGFGRTLGKCRKSVSTHYLSACPFLGFGCSLLWVWNEWYCDTFFRSRAGWGFWHSSDRSHGYTLLPGYALYTSIDFIKGSQTYVTCSRRMVCREKAILGSYASWSGHPPNSLQTNTERIKVTQKWLRQTDPKLTPKSDSKVTPDPIFESLLGSLWGGIPRYGPNPSQTKPVIANYFPHIQSIELRSRRQTTA